jgi:hypothetical protein
MRMGLKENKMRNRNLRKCYDKNKKIKNQKKIEKNIK